MPRYPTPESDQARFWAKVHKTENPDACWIWTGNSNPKGYGRFFLDGKMIGPHMYSYKLHGGVLPQGMVVCHKCPGKHNPACVNPRHLYAGTRHQNWWDAVHNGAIDLAKNPCLRIKDEDISMLRILYLNGFTQAQLTRIFHISATYVWMLVHHQQRRNHKLLLELTLNASLDDVLHGHTKQPWRTRRVRS